MLELKNPDYKTAVRIADAINDYARDRFREPLAYEVDSRTVESVPAARMSALRGSWPRSANCRSSPDMAARVVLDARTGTVVIGQDVQISTVAVTYGTLTVRVNETAARLAARPFSNGRTVVTPNTKIETNRKAGRSPSSAARACAALVGGLNRIGVKPPGIIAILQAIKTAGALQADLVIQ